MCRAKLDTRNHLQNRRAPQTQSPGGWSPRPESGRGEDWEVQTRPCRSEQPGPTVGHRSCTHSPGTDHSGEERAEHVEPGRRAAQRGCAGLQHNTANRPCSSEGRLRSSLWRRPSFGLLWAPRGSALRLWDDARRGQCPELGRCGVTLHHLTHTYMKGWLTLTQGPPRAGLRQAVGWLAALWLPKAAGPEKKILMTRRGQALDTDVDMRLLYVYESLNQTPYTSKKHNIEHQLKSNRINCGEKKSRAWNDAAPCGLVLEQPLESRGSWAPHIHKACGAVKDSCPQGMCWDKSSENSKQVRLTRSQLQAESWSHTV